MSKKFNLGRLIVEVTYEIDNDQENVIQEWLKSSKAVEELNDRIATIQSTLIDKADVSYVDETIGRIQNGVDGKSAYDIWLEEGNSGSKSDFLNSLKAESKVEPQPESEEPSKPIEEPIEPTPVEENPVEEEPIEETPEEPIVESPEPIEESEKIKNVIKDIMPKDTGEEHLYPQIFVYQFDARREPQTPTEVTIYISDFYDSIYTLDAELYFDVRVEIDREVEIHKNVRGGDYTINFGVLPEGEHTISFQIIDKSGRKSQRIFYDILVRSYYISPEETYNATSTDLNKYNIALGLTSKTATELAMKKNRFGLNALINDISSKGFKKIVLPNGLYRVMKSSREKYNLDSSNPIIIIPSNFTVDLNGSVIKLHTFLDKDYDDTTNATINFIDSYDSHLINGVLEGDWIERQQFKSEFEEYEGEGTNNIEFNGNSKFCTMRNVTVKHITGYNIGSGLHNTHVSETSGWKDNTYINEATGEEIHKSGYTTTSFIKIDKEYLDSGQIACNYWLGYGGIRGEQVDMWLSFYDKDRKLVEQIQVYQFRRCVIPQGSHFIRATVRGLAKDVEELVFHDHATPKGILLIDCHWENNQTCVAPAQFQHFMIKDCTFYESGYSITPCAVDLEDGWEQMQDFFLVNCEIQKAVGTADLITNSGYNHHIVGNTNWRMYLRSGIRGLVVENNENSSIISGKGDNTGYTVRIRNNELNYFGFSEWGEDSKRDPYQMIRDNVLEVTFINSSPTLIVGGTYALGVHSTLNCIDVTITELVDSYAGNYSNGDNIFSYCKFTGNDEYPIYIHHFNYDSEESDGSKFLKCIFESPTELVAHNYFSKGIWEECIFKDDLYISPSWEAEMGKIRFNDCVFDKPVTYTDAKIQFNNCIFKQGVECTGESQAQFNNCIGV